VNKEGINLGISDFPITKNDAGEFVNYKKLNGCTRLRRKSSKPNGHCLARKKLMVVGQATLKDCEPTQGRPA
jgi:hypothetical protein